MAQGLFPPAYGEFVRLFRQGEYRAANDVLEHYWQDHRHGVYKGLIQLAVALLQQENGRPAGTRKLLDKARSNLAPFASGFQGLDVAGLLAAIEAADRALSRAGEGVGTGGRIPAETIQTMGYILAAVIKS